MLSAYSPSSRRMPSLSVHGLAGDDCTRKTKLEYGGSSVSDLVSWQSISQSLMACEAALRRGQVEDLHVTRTTKQNSTGKREDA